MALLPTLAQVRLALSISDTSGDAELVRMGEAVTMVFQNFMGRTLEKATVTEYFNSNKNYSYFLSSAMTATDNSSIRVNQANIPVARYPIDTGEAYSVYYSPRREYLATEKLVENDGFVLDPDNGRVLILSAMNKGVRTIRVDYTGGYAVATDSSGPVTYDHMSAAAPADMVEAAILQIAFMRKRTIDGSFGMQETGDSTSTQYTTNAFLIPEAKELLMAHRRLFAAVV